MIHFPTINNQEKIEIISS
ncbi:unnamed protein product, partial [Vitis vinifera]|uniref:Uncharacterized protein n=1 Tax=Vitis vinifera TaxID=29760 RepID=D7SSY6_VITVI